MPGRLPVFRKLSRRGGIATLAMALIPGRCSRDHRADRVLAPYTEIMRFSRLSALAACAKGGSGVLAGPVANALLD